MTGGARLAGKDWDHFLREGMISARMTKGIGAWRREIGTRIMLSLAAMIRMRMTGREGRKGSFG